jgi:hypothetical protein
MFNSAILDVAIGLIFVFLLVSTLCAAIREGIESVLKSRATFLEYTVRELLADRAGTGMTRKVFGHPLIRGLFMGDYTPRSSPRPNSLTLGRDLPSYIPARSFASALLDIAARGADFSASADASPITVRTLRASVVANVDNVVVQRAVIAAIDAGGDDLERIRKNLESWFDGAMDRVSGWYKRASQKFILAIALAVSFGLNLNAITIADALYRDRTLRDAAVAAAERHVQNDEDSQDVKSVVDQLDALHLPIGWDRGWPDSFRDASAAEAADPDAEGNLWSNWIRPLAGLLITVLAALLGAPFWFDVLNRVMVIRATVKPHEKSREEASEDRQLTRAGAAPASTIQIVVPNGTSSASGQPLLRSGPPDNDIHEDNCDGCDVAIDEATPDEALPPSIGGVG